MDNKELWFSLIGEDLKAECDRLISLTDEMRAEGKIIFPEKRTCPFVSGNYMLASWGAIGCDTQKY